MRVYDQPTGEVIRLVESQDDLVQFKSWLDTRHRVAVDTETTGLQIYKADFHVRLLIIADSTQAWVIPAEAPYQGLGYLAAMYLDRQQLGLVFHNASYDTQVLAGYELPISDTFERSHDTKIYAHLIDPRGREEGGTGHSLDELANWYLGAPKLKDELRQEFMRLRRQPANPLPNFELDERYAAAVSIKDRKKIERMIQKEWEHDTVIPFSTPVSEMYPTMPLFNEVFIRYAGQDALLTMQLFEKFNSSIKPPPNLISFEHKLASIMTQVDAKGFLLDEEYARDLSESLSIQEEHWKGVAAGFGLVNINSPQQVIEALAKRGIHSDKVTPNGQPTVDKFLLAQHAEDPLVKAIIEGKKAGKWRTTWVQSFLDGVDPAGRVHPSTNTLRARTARFSITGIPAQTLPASDSLIRNCFVADPGEVVVSADYSQQELRYAAAASKDARLMRMLLKGGDPYQLIADELGSTRKRGKLVALATLYGVGKTKLAEQIEGSEEDADGLRQGFRSSYPHLNSYGRQLAAEAESAGSVITANGRRLPVDANRTYSALNYYVQSGCRDITAQALTDLADAGYLGNMRLAIHDEVVFSLPQGADLKDIENLMGTKVGGVDIPAEAKAGQRSWGSLYETPVAAVGQ